MSPMYVLILAQKEPAPFLIVREKGLDQKPLGRYKKSRLTQNLWGQRGTAFVINACPLYSRGQTKATKLTEANPSS